MTTHDVGYRSASAAGVIGVVYALVVALGMTRYGLSTPIGDPILAIMEVLTIASAAPLLVMLTAVSVLAPVHRRLESLLSFASATSFAAITCVVHFVELTAGRQLETHGMVWPSVAYAAELLAWDVFLGCALILGARILSDWPTARGARSAMRLAGALALLGTIGPLSGQMRLQLVGVVGYGVILPIAAFALASWFGSVRRASVS